MYVKFLSISCDRAHFQFIIIYVHVYTCIYTMNNLHVHVQCTIYMYAKLLHWTAVYVYMYMHTGMA